MINLSERSLIHSINYSSISDQRAPPTSSKALNSPLFESLTEEGIFLPESILGVEQGLRCRPGFTDQADLPQELADLCVVARAHWCVGPARIADVHTEMLHRRFHHRRKTVCRPLSGEERIAT